MTSYLAAAPMVPVRCGLVRSPYYIARDVPSDVDIDMYSLESYFKDGIIQFEGLVHKLYSTASVFTEDDARQLMFMLECLIHARGEIDALENGEQLSL